MCKKVLFSIIFLFVITKIIGQQQRQIGWDWQIGVGGDIVRFNDEDAKYIGDKHLIQIPRFNITRRLNHFFALDGSISFGAFDSVVINNQVPYFSLDGSLRFKYITTYERLDPYIFIGGSIVQSDPKRKTTPTINAGTGLTVWLTEGIGINGQALYKHSLESFESMRSHIQVSFSVIFGVNFSRSKRHRSSSSCYHNPNRRSRSKVSTSCQYNQHKKKRRRRRR